MDKVVSSADAAIADVGDGASIMVGGFGDSGFPHDLVAALQRKAPRALTIINNGAAFGSLVTEGCIRHLICSYPVGPSSLSILPALEAGDIGLEVIPQGTFIERIRAGGAGLGGVLTSVGIDLVEWSEAPSEFFELDGQRYLLARPLRAQFALVRGYVADRWGNVFCRRAARNFNPVMAMAADVTIVQVARVVEPGELDPEHVHIPSPFVDRIVVCPPVEETARALD